MKSNTDFNIQDEEESILSPDEGEFLEKRGYDSLAERLKVQLTARNGKLQYLKDVIKRLQADLLKATSKLNLKADQPSGRLILLDKNRSRVRIKRLQDEVTCLSTQVIKYKEGFESVVSRGNENELRVGHLLEELDKERSRVQKMSVLLAACRRREFEHRALLAEVQNLRAEKHRQEFEHQSISYILKVGRLQRSENFKLLKQAGAVELNQLAEAFPYRKHTIREANTVSRPATPRTPRSTREGSALVKQLERQNTPEVERCIPRTLRESKFEARRDTVTGTVSVPSRRSTDGSFRTIVARKSMDHRRSADAGDSSRRVTYKKDVTMNPGQMDFSAAIPRPMSQSRKKMSREASSGQKFQTIAAKRMSLAALTTPEKFEYASTVSSEEAGTSRLRTLLTSKQGRGDTTSWSDREAFNTDVHVLRRRHHPGDDMDNREATAAPASPSLQTWQTSGGASFPRPGSPDSPRSRLMLGEDSSLPKPVTPDEMVKACWQANAGPSLPRPTTPFEDNEGEDEHFYYRKNENALDYDGDYVKQLEKDLAEKCQRIKCLELELKKRDEELETFVVSVLDDTNPSRLDSTTELSRSLGVDIDQPARLNSAAELAKCLAGGYRSPKPK